VYFAGADTVYFTALPTKCSYPVPTFLYRTQVADTEQLHSFTENIECFADPRNELLAYQPGLASMIKRDKTVLHTIRAGFDCKHPLARTPDTLFCPRKHRPGS